MRSPSFSWKTGGITVLLLSQERPQHELDLKHLLLCDDDCRQHVASKPGIREELVAFSLLNNYA
jgi:hypothetical protein